MLRSLAVALSFLGSLVATGIPIVKLSEEESTRLLKMEDELHKRVIGQEEAVKALSAGPSGVPVPA